MRVFLPYQDYARSAKCLTDDHLKEMRNSCRNLIQVLTVPNSYSGDMTHVAIWAPCMNGLLWLTDATLYERRRRGHDERGVTPWMLYRRDQTHRPYWLGNAEFHATHRAYLLEKAPAHYGRMGWS